MKKEFYRLTALLSLLLLLTGCGAEPARETEAATAAATEPTVLTTAETAEETVEPSIANGMEFAPTEVLGDAVQTPYITLYCPVEWQGLVQMDQREENGDYSVTFHTAIADADTELFTLVFSPNAREEGFVLGSLEDAQVIYITALMNEARPETWSQEDSGQFNAMQERINDLIQQLHEDPRFVPGR